MKKLVLSTLVMLGLAYPGSVFANGDDALAFEGKVMAQVVRHVSVPFPIIVDKVFVGIGDDVQKQERLLEYHLEDRTERSLQNELFAAGGRADWTMQKSSLEQELISSSSRRKLSSALAARELASQEENAANARMHGLVSKRLDAVKQKERAAMSDFAYRLRELEKDLGHQLKAGQEIPKILYMTAPMAATVISMSPQARPMGQLSGTAFTLGVLNPIQVQFQVHESEIARLHAGQAVTVELDRDTKIRVPGKVTMLSWQPTDTTIAVPSFYYVWVDAENNDYVLKPGNKVIVHVRSADDRNR